MYAFGLVFDQQYFKFCRINFNDGHGVVVIMIFTGNQQVHMKQTEEIYSKTKRSQILILAPMHDVKIIEP